MSKQPIARTLANYIEHLTFNDLPDDVIESTKTRLLDNLSCCYAGHDLPWSKVAVEAVKRNKGEGTIIAHEEKVSAMDAALVNGVQSHSILQEDTMKGGKHPSTIIPPAVLAVAEQENASGAHTILAIVLGYDIIFRISLSSEEGLHVRRGFRPNPIFGIFGAAAASGKLMKLNEEQLTHAIGYAANMASGLTETWQSGTMDSMFQVGLAARNGILSAILGKAGATAAERTLEGTSGFYEAF